MSEDLEPKIREIGEELWRRMAGERPGLFDRDYWEGQLLDWAMGDPAFRADLFRLIDVLPVLETAAQVASHVSEYLQPHREALSGLLAAGLRVATSGLGSGISAHLVRNRVGALGDRFIAGRNAEEALPRLRQLHGEGFAFTVDLLGEATVSTAEAEACEARYRDLVEHLPPAVAEWPGEGTIDRNHEGPIPRTNVSLKISALDPLLDPADPSGGVSRLKARVLPILLRARDRGAAVHLDMESWEVHGITLELFEDLATDPSLREWPHLGATIQAYLKSSREDAERLASVARFRRAPFPVRLVKGAYWDYEVAHASQYGRPCPVFTSKAATDECFEELSSFLLRHHDLFQPAFASHNLRSLAHAAAQARDVGVPDNAFEVQTLFGMAEPERKALRSLGFRVRIYTPIGELLPGMAYLVRRLLENTSSTGILRLTHREGVQPAELLAAPRPPPPAPEPKEAPSGDLAAPFTSCALSDFTDPSVRSAFARAIHEVSESLPAAVPVVIEGAARSSGPALDHPCPSDTGRLASRVTLATREEAERAVAAAAKAWPAWRDRSVEERARLLESLARRLEADRFRLAALETWEEAKPWPEADADVAETVDYCRYYARQARQELAPRRLEGPAGEENWLSYEGRGVAAVIAPWNFPLAILCGMTAAALVAGNTVVLKPAEQSSAAAYALYEHLLATGFPPGAVQFLPGIGEEIGSFLVEHPRVAQIAFTGSKAVGLSIVEAAGRTRPGQAQVKRVVCEMGGKNAVIVDEDADLDEAVRGVVRSAFSYAGQKCSAASRVITVGRAHQPFVARLVEACRSLPVRPAHEPGCLLGPVIDREAFDRLRAVLADPGPGATPLFVGEAPAGGLYVPAAVFEVADPSHRLMQEELFGPVLAVYGPCRFEEALAAALATDYALTGSVYSRTPSHLEEAKRRFRVGNLYLNRPCTGAMVGRQPFGGFGMSGLGTKAGGPGYLLNFADPRCTTENTMRRGFTPEGST